MAKTKYDFRKAEDVRTAIKGMFGVDKDYSHMSDGQLRELYVARYKQVVDIQVKNYGRVSKFTRKEPPTDKSKLINAIEEFNLILGLTKLLRRGSKIVGEESGVEPVIMIVTGEGS